MSMTTEAQMREQFEATALMLEGVHNTYQLDFSRDLDEDGDDAGTYREDETEYAYQLFVAAHQSATEQMTGKQCCEHNCARLGATVSERLGRTLKVSREREQPTEQMKPLVDIVRLYRTEIAIAVQTAEFIGESDLSEARLRKLQADRSMLQSIAQALAIIGQGGK